MIERLRGFPYFVWHGEGGGAGIYISISIWEEYYLGDFAP